jgi:uncharacterized membrane protein required for colicin V production
MANVIRPWWQFNPAVLDFTVFVLVLLIGILTFVRFLGRKLVDLIKWDSLSWLVQGLGLFLGCVRGLWCMGLALLMLVATNVIYFNNSIQDRSVLGPHLINVSKRAIEETANRFPGAINRKELIPVIKL